ANANRALSFVNQLSNMFALSEIIAKGALLRDESRGAHYKPEFSLPEPKTRDPNEDPEWMELWRQRNEKWAKITIAKHTPNGVDISYKDLPTPVLDPEPRDRKSTRLNSSHVKISYAVFCLKQKR